METISLEDIRESDVRKLYGGFKGYLYKGAVTAV